MFTVYNKSNVFAKILRGEIEANYVYKNDFAVSFYDINPQERVHILVIPTGEYIDNTDFYINATDDEKLGFINCVKESILWLNIEGGYKIQSNNNQLGGQEIPHMHWHIIAK